MQPLAMQEVGEGNSLQVFTLQYYNDGHCNSLVAMTVFVTGHCNVSLQYLYNSGGVTDGVDKSCVRVYNWR